MAAPSSGFLTISLKGTLADIVANFNTIVNTLQGQGIDPTSVKNALVQVELTQPSFTQTAFGTLDSAIVTLRGTLAATTLQIVVTLILSG